MTDTTTLSNGAAGPVVETFESLFGTPPVDAPPEPETGDGSADTGTQVDGKEPQDTALTSGAEGGQDEIAKAKEHTPKGVQKRLDELTRQREDERREKEAYRQQAEAAMRAIEELSRRVGQPQEQQAPAQPQPPNDGRPDIRNFTDVSEYIDAVTDWKIQQQEAQRQAQTFQSRIDAMEADARQRHEDYDAVINRFVSSPLAQHPAVFQTLKESDHSAELAYRIATDPSLAQELAKLPMHRAMAKLAALEDSLSSPTPAAEPAVSSAPPPPGKIDGGAPIVDPAKVNAAHVDASDIAARVEATRKRYIAQGLKPPY